MFFQLGVPSRRPKGKPRLGTYLVGFLIMLPICAAQAISNGLTLDQALKNTLNHKPELKVFTFKRQVLNGELKTASLSPELALSIDADNIAGSGEAEYTVALSSSIELGGQQDARVALANSGLGYLEAQFQVEALAALGDVTRCYVQVLASQERLALAQTSNDLASRALKRVQARFSAGAAPKADVLRAQAAASQARLNLSSRQQELDGLKVLLASLWGETHAKFNGVQGNLYEFGQDATFEQLYTKLLQNPAIEVFAAQERLEQAQLRLIQSQSSNDISWSIGVRQFQASNNNALVAGINMPLFSGSRNRGAMDSARARLNQVDAQKDAALLRLRTQLYQAYGERQQAIQRANTLKNDVVPALEKALVETRKAYQKGRYSYIDYVSARQDLLNGRSALIEAATAALTLAAEIEQLSAQPLSISGLADNKVKG